MNYELPIYDITIDEAMHLGVDEIAFVNEPAIEELFIAMAKDIELKLSSDDKMILTGPALIPGKKIYRIDKLGNEYFIRFSAEAIQAIVQRYFTKNKQINFNLEHNKKVPVEGVIIESWIVKDENMDQSIALGFKPMIKGTWFISVKVEDKQFWEDYVKTGLTLGFSVEGAFSQSLVEEMSKIDKLVINPKSGETKDEFVSRCIAFEVGNGYDVDQATAMCYSKWDEGVNLNETEPKLSDFTLTAEEAEYLIKAVLLAKDSYNDYPMAATENAKRALKYKDENPGNNCGTRVGWARANQLAKRRSISEETIARMASFARHAQYKDVPYDEGCGGLMYDCWGGEEGVLWAQRKLMQIRREDKK